MARGREFQGTGLVFVEEDKSRANDKHVEETNEKDAQLLEDVVPITFIHPIQILSYDTHLICLDLEIYD